MLKLKTYFTEKVVPFAQDKDSEQGIDVFHRAADIAEKDKLLLIQMNSPSSPVLVPNHLIDLAVAIVKYQSKMLK